MKRGDDVLYQATPLQSGVIFFSYNADSAGLAALQMGEILRLKRNADSVTLSACSTDLGRLFN
jgi:hypothetical protein